MNNQLATQQEPKTSALKIMADRLHVDPARLLTTLKNTVFKNASDDEIVALVIVANQYNLSPILKELYAFPAKGGGIVPMVSVDGWLRIINSQPMLDGIQFSDLHENGKLIATTCRIYRKDRAHPIEVTEYLSECKRSTEPWKMEHRMLRHKALIQCARVAFGFSGIYDEDEANDIREAKGRVVPAARVPAAPSFLPAPGPLGPQVTGDTKEDHIPFELDATPETSLERLKRKLIEDNVPATKVEAFLEKESLPSLDMLLENEAEAVLAGYQSLLQHAK